METKFGIGEEVIVKFGDEHITTLQTAPMYHSSFNKEELSGEYEYECSVVIYGTVKVKSNKPLDFDEVCAVAVEQVVDNDPTGTYEVCLPELPDNEIVQCVKQPE